MATDGTTTEATERRRHWKRQRPRLKQVHIPVLDSEDRELRARAAAVGLPVATYLRNLGLGYEPRAALDHERVQEMLRINGDLGRLGGLLKLWLTDDPKLRQFDDGQIRHAIRAALQKIEATQGELRGVVKTALRGGSD